jgi:four helix bundle protein
MLCQKEFVVGSWWFVVVFSSVIYCLWQPFKSLRSWKFGNWPGTFSKDLSIDILAPIAKDFRYKDQIRGTCGSIMDNIAEGFEGGSKLEFINSLTIAKGKAGELKSQLYRGFDNNYVNQTLFGELYELANRITKLLTTFINYLNKSTSKGQMFKERH